MAKTKIDDFIVRQQNRLIFDTNVWLLLFNPIGNFERKHQDKYSKLLSSVLSRNASIYIPAVILSEFANVVLRHEFSLWKDRNQNQRLSYKRDFMPTQDYRNQHNLVINLLDRIMKLDVVEKISDGFNTVSLDDINSYFDSVDYNDAIIADIAERNSLKVVTNDSDFFKLSHRLDVISALN
ncbi:MAG: PIN domain-containing protein [Nonlabens sp.]